MHSREATRGRSRPSDGSTLPAWRPLNVPSLARSRRARIEHLLPSRNRPRHASHPRRQTDQARSHGRALRSANSSGLWLSGSASGHGWRGRRGGGRGGSRAAERAVLELSRGLSTAGHARGRIDRRVSRTSPSSRLAQLAEAMIEVLGMMTQAICGFTSRPPRTNILLGKGARV